MNRRFLKIYSSLLAIILVLCLTLCGCDMLDGETPSDGGNSPSVGTSDSDSDGSTRDSDSDNPPADVGEQRAAEKALGVPAFSGSPFFALNNNEPKFTLAEKTKVVAYESYSPLDSLGRCGYAQSCVGKELMPTEDRESISSVKPSGRSSVPDAERIAAAIGWLEPYSAIAASVRSSSLLTPIGDMFVTENRPEVTVPVLSNATVSADATREKTFPPLNNIPRDAAPPMPPKNAIGTDITSAQGQDITRKISAR